MEMDNLTTNKWAVEVLESNMTGYTPEERKQYLEDVRAHGCQSGAVGGVIYYHETETIFKENMRDILNLVSEYKEETGFNPLETIADDDNIHNLDNYLVWFVVEVTAQNMLQEVEELEEA